MKKKNRNLLLYGFSGFGPNLLMTILTVYFIDAVIIDGLGTQTVDAWSIAGKTIVIGGLFSLLWTLAKILDGIIDIPLSNLLENMKSKWGKRKLGIAIGFTPMLLAFFLLWLQPFQNNLTANTWWIFGCLLIFYISYTFTMLSYYSSFILVTDSESERVKLSSYKSFFDVIGYSIAYALIPVFLSPSLNIRMLVFILMPLIFTMLIPLFKLKNEDRENSGEQVKARFRDQLKGAFKNPNFLKYLGVLIAIHLGLQLYLTSQNAIASGVLDLTTMQTALLNTAAFAPVPLMLILFNYVQKEKGLRYSYRTATVAFGVGISMFALASAHFFPGDNLVYVRLIIGIFGSIIASYAIGPLFSFTYLMPTQLAANEYEEKGVNNSSMFFAVQGLVNQVVAAIATGLIYSFWIKDNLNLSFINLPVEGNNGIFIVPILVLIFMVISFVMAMLLPVTFEKHPEKAEKNPNITKRSALRMTLGILYSGTLILFVLPFLQIFEINKLNKKGKSVYIHILITFLTAGLYLLFIYAINIKAIEKVTDKKRFVLFLILSLFGVGLIVNPIIMQSDLNKVADQYNIAENHSSAEKPSIIVEQED